MADFVYNIVEARLTGTLNGVLYNALAYSGGRGGTKTKGASHAVLVNNPFLTHIKKDSWGKDSPGGALPLGNYRLFPHESEPNWIRLIPKTQNNMFGRGGFAIHGRGPRGSDGCIVPDEFWVVLALYQESLFRMKNGVKPLTLRVIAIGDLDYYFNKIDRYSRLV